MGKVVTMNVWRTIVKYRAPIFAMAAFSVFGMIIAGTPCLIRVVTGFPCPGCGLTRATLALLNLDFKSALVFNPMVFFIWPLIIFLIYLYISRKNQMKIFTPVFISFGVLMISVFVIRMIIYYPDSTLLTYDYNSIFGRMIRFLINII
ncbi:MAG: DUF2752 domain-containing protein [Saccharofermentanales bacterium]